MSSAQAFDQAFAPLSDDRIDRLATLIGSVTHINLAAGTADITDNGETLHVAPHYCAHCNAIHGHEHDGEGDCIHKRALGFAIAAEIEHRDTHACLPDLDERREAYYEAGEYPPNPIR